MPWSSHLQSVLLTLTLLVLGVLADAHDFALALDDLALLAHGLDAGTYFHVYFLLLVSTAAAPLPYRWKVELLGTPGDPAPSQIVGAHLHRDFVAGQDTDEVHPQLAGNVSQDGVSVADVHHEHGVRQRFHDCALELNNVVFSQNRALLKCRPRSSGSPVRRL